jgi:hypothetical protein
MINKFIIYDPISKDFKPLSPQLYTFFINSLCIELTKRNIINIVTDKILKLSHIDYKNTVILIIVNPHFINDYIEIKNEIKYISDNFKYKILYLTEPINFLVEKNINLNLIKFIKPYCLWTYTYENFNKINTKINIYKVFPNFNEAYNLTEINLENIKRKNREKIFFFGNINENRKHVCNQFNNYLMNINDCWTHEQWANILNNNLFYLNIHRRSNCKAFESFRIIPILANGCVIFSESVNKMEEEEFNDYNIIFSEKNKLYDSFLKYINNINYEIILEKCYNFRKNIVINNDLDKFINFHNNI